MMTSDEYESHSTGWNDGQFVQTMFQNVLGRNISEGDIASWCNLMPGTSGRINVGYMIVASQEAQQRYASASNEAYVSMLFQAVLGRSSGVGADDGWVQALNNGSLNRIQVAQGFLYSDEFASKYLRPSNEVFIKELYNDALGRDPEPGAWISQLNSGISRSDIAYAIVESMEAHTHLAAQKQQSYYG